jgi:hypothetical protein
MYKKIECKKILKIVINIGIKRSEAKIKKNI